jgi:hypothetical protein
MLQAHSLLWHYLWVAPNVLLLVLANLIWRRKLSKQYPVFLFFAIVSAIEQLTVYLADLLPSVSAETWYYTFGGGLLVEALIKFAVIGEIFGVLWGMYPSLAKLGRLLISGFGAALLFLATAVAAYTPENSANWMVSHVHIFEQTIYMIECGLILFVFGFAAYFKLRWSRPAFGIILGLGISACVHLATWALMATPHFSEAYSVRLVFLNMATYHVCVLIWFYYLLGPPKKIPRSGGPPLSEHRLEVWNQELERLLHQ